MVSIEAAKRIFKNGAEALIDPDGSMTPEEVLEYYAHAYPELTNASIGDAEVDDDGNVVYTFSVNIGKKG